MRGSLLRLQIKRPAPKIRALRNSDDVELKWRQRTLDVASLLNQGSNRSHQG